jgi:osmotically-inducible protein OsmY
MTASRVASLARAHRRAATLALLVAIGLVVVAGCKTVDPRDDVRIEAEVKARLVAEKDANLTRLGVLCTDRTVYLSGTVRSPEQAARAEAIAKGVSGVQRVVNTVTIAGPPR